MKKIALFLSVLLSLSIISCAHSSSLPENLDWLKNLITTFEKEPVGNPPQSIWEYEYKGKTVYYVPPQCCDQFSTLYDAIGNVIGAPDGGFTGRGDGKHADFSRERKNGKLIWKDSRTR